MQNNNPESWRMSYSSLNSGDGLDYVIKLITSAQAFGFSWKAHRIAGNNIIFYATAAREESNILRDLGFGDGN